MSHFEHGTWLTAWATDEWNLGYFWRWSDLVQRAILIGLAVMLGYTFFVLIRFFLRYRLTRHELRDLDLDISIDSRQRRKQIVADLGRGLGSLRAITTGAPFLALAGTSYGIMAAFYVFAFRARVGHGFINGLSEGLAAALINTACGILVATVTLLTHNQLCLAIERDIARCPPRGKLSNDFGSFQFAQTLSLRKRISGLPHFALPAITFLSFAFLLYVAFRIYPIPTGLRVRLLPIGALLHRDRSIESLIISVHARSDGETLIRLNSTEISSDKLEEFVGQKLQGRSEREVYIEGDRSAPWANVANAIDRIEALHCRVVLLTTNPEPPGSAHRGTKIHVATPPPLR